MNENKKALLSFCVLNALAIVNAKFENNNISNYTWQHPGSKKWQALIIIVIIAMTQSQRKLFRDLSVLHSGLIMNYFEYNRQLLPQRVV